LPYSAPGFYSLMSLSSSPSNSITLGFASHEPVVFSPVWKGPFEWRQGPPSRNPITAPSTHLYDYKIFPEEHFAYFQLNQCFDKNAILDGLKTYANPWLRPMLRAWLAVELHRKKPAAILRRSYDPERPVFKDYLASAIRDIQEHGITNLIIDLRHNSGGETELCRQFLYHLTRRDDLKDSHSFYKDPKLFAYYGGDESTLHPVVLKGNSLSAEDRSFFEAVTNTASQYYVPPGRPVFNGRIIVLVDQSSESAASLFAGLLQDNGLAEIVGTTGANNPTGLTGFSPFILPRSGILVSLPNAYVERALPSNGGLLQPDYWVENSPADIMTGRDAPFEKALELVNQSPKSP
jgi:hypothetical protein